MVTITIQMNDGVTEDKKQKVIVGNEIDSVDYPEREKYSFGGWFTSSDFTNQISFPHIFNQDTEIYAKWIEKKIDGSISFNGNGAAGEMKEESYALGTSINYIECAFVHEGYDFLGWYSSPDAKETTKITFPYIFEGSVTFYASWKMNIPEGQCLIKYDLMGGEGVLPTKVSGYQNYEIIFLERPPNLKRSYGKVFYGWTMSPQEATPMILSYFQNFTLNSFYVKDGIVTFYDLWLSDYYTITFDLGKATGNNSPVYVDKEKHKSYQAIKLPAFTIDYPGYGLEGWGTTQEYANYLANAEIPSNTITKDTTLYAFYYKIPLREDIPLNSDKYKGQTLWLKGINEIAPERWEMYYNMYPDLKAVPWESGVDNWFDAKKLDPNGVDSNLCWAASASNAIHWFLDRNKQYVDKYFELYPDDPKPDSHFNGVGDSGVFNDFKKNWENYAQMTRNGYNWYIKGSDRQGEGYFKRVFEGKVIVNETVGSSTYISRNLFNTFITDALERGQFVTWTGVFGLTHALTLYAVEYDDDGWIRTLIYTDSNNINVKTYNTKKPISLERVEIYYFDEDVQLPYFGDPESLPNKKPIAYYKDYFVDGNYNKIIDAQSYDLQTDVWEEFFKNHPTK